MILTLGAPAGAADFDRLFFELDTSAHWPQALAAPTPTTSTISFSAVRPVLHEVGVLYGVGSRSLAGDVVMRSGYRFAQGSLPPASKIGNADGDRYALNAVPILFGWHMTFLQARVRPLLALEAGGLVSKLEYGRVGDAPLSSGWAWCFSARGGVGAEVAVWEYLTARVVLQGEWTEAAAAAHGPGLSMSHLGVGVGLVARPPLLGRGDASAVADDDTGLRDYEGGGAVGRAADAAALIRAGDAAVKKRDFIAAEDRYRRGVAALARDPETRRNVELPVRLDWARVLVEVGRGADAAVVLTEGLEIDPANPRIRAALDDLRRRGITPPPVAPPPAMTVPPY
ncbi:MAG: hypothetical protein HY903_20440 [Deltaproteobacteria bacterium]|nr:hypothetical protein [Deltaproteobacteria bacterium]